MEESETGPVAEVAIPRGNQLVPNMRLGSRTDHDPASIPRRGCRFDRGDPAGAARRELSRSPS
jgi:hypothetical protein